MNKKACCVFIVIITFLSTLFFSTSFDGQNLTYSAFLRWENQDEENPLFDYNNSSKILAVRIYPVLFDLIVDFFDQLTFHTFQTIPTEQGSLILRC
jgi:hypothetical protein